VLERSCATGMTMTGKSQRSLLVLKTLTACRYKDQNGWPLTKVVLINTRNGTELRYPPFDIVVTK
jgi:hypothetical protein